MFFGANAEGLAAKMDSFDKILQDLRPPVFTLQEVKMKPIRGKDRAIKTAHSIDYVIFQLIRKGGKEGEGLATGALKDLKPIIIREGDNDIEILSIEINVSGFKIRVINGYSPQLSDTKDKKNNYWALMDREVTEAEELGHGLVIQIDGNLHAGPKVVKDDPVSQCRNGKIFL